MSTNTPYQPTHPVNTAYQQTLSTHCQHTLSSRPLPTKPRTHSHHHKPPMLSPPPLPCHHPTRVLAANTTNTPCINPLSLPHHHPYLTTLVTTLVTTTPISPSLSHHPYHHPCHSHHHCHHHDHLSECWRPTTAWVWTPYAPRRDTRLTS